MSFRYRVFLLVFLAGGLQLAIAQMSESEAAETLGALLAIPTQAPEVTVTVHEKRQEENLIIEASYRDSGKKRATKTRS